MPRKKKQLDATEAYNAAFPSRLRDLMRQSNTTQSALAVHLGIARQSCAAYCDGSSSPTWEGIVKIAKFFGCSSDYLLGLSEHRSKETEGVTLSQLGLSEQAIKNLMVWQYSDAMDGLNLMLSVQDTYIFNALCHIVITKRLAEKALHTMDCIESPKDLVGVIDKRTGELRAWVGVSAEFSINNTHNLYREILEKATGYSELKEAMNKKMQEYQPQHREAPEKGG